MVDCSPPNACSQCLTSPNTSSSPFLSLPFTPAFLLLGPLGCLHMGIYFFHKIEITTSNPIMLIAVTYLDLTSKMTGIHPKMPLMLPLVLLHVWPFLESARDFNSIIIRLHFPSLPSPLFLLLCCYLTFRKCEGNFLGKIFNKINRGKCI